MMSFATIGRMNVHRFHAFLPRHGPTFLAPVLAGMVVAAMAFGSAASDFAADRPDTPTNEQMRRGSEVYHQICFACHQLNGRGIPGTYPPLAGSKILLHQRERVIAILLRGLQGPVKVRGKHFNNVMPELNLSDRQIADVLTYALNRWGNAGGAVREKTVAQEREFFARHPGQSEAGPAAAPNGGMMPGMGMMGGHGMMGGGGPPPPAHS
jgi:mono/diheme cytochrome c family protein